MTDDLISRQAAIDAVSKACEECRGTFTRCEEKLLALPSAQQEPEEFEWCTDCKEYDQTAHCCHRWTKVIRNTVEELKQQTIDAVSVIMCKDCQHWESMPSSTAAPEIHRCRYWRHIGTVAYDFCSKAERKEE